MGDAMTYSGDQSREGKVLPVGHAVDASHGRSTAGELG